MGNKAIRSTPAGFFFLLCDKTWLLYHFVRLALPESLLPEPAPPTPVLVLPPPPTAAVTTAQIISRPKPSTNKRSRSLSAPKEISAEEQEEEAPKKARRGLSPIDQALETLRGARAQLLQTNKTSRARKIIIDTLVSQSLIRSDRIVAEIKEKIADTVDNVAELTNLFDELIAIVVSVGSRANGSSKKEESSDDSS